ncbi:unnamed protein product, partial [Rotaria sp. Silwood1]
MNANSNMNLDTLKTHSQDPQGR